MLLLLTYVWTFWFSLNHFSQRSLRLGFLTPVQTISKSEDQTRCILFSNLWSLNCLISNQGRSLNLVLALYPIPEKNIFKKWVPIWSLVSKFILYWNTGPENPEHINSYSYLRLYFFFLRRTAITGLFIKKTQVNTGRSTACSWIWWCGCYLKEKF